MRFTVSPEQLKFFHIQGFLELEDLLGEEEVSLLTAEIDAIKNKSPGYPEENLFRSTSFIHSLIKKRGWGQVGAELLHKKPLRLAYDRFFTTSPLFTDSLDDDSCGLLIHLETRRGFFFKQFDLIRDLHNSSKSCYFLLILTAKYLPGQLNPVIVK